MYNFTDRMKWVQFKVSIVYTLNKNIPRKISSVHQQAKCPSYVFLFKSYINIKEFGLGA